METKLVNESGVASTSTQPPSPRMSLLLTGLGREAKASCSDVLVARKVRAKRALGAKENVNRITKEIP